MITTATAAARTRTDVFLVLADGDTTPHLEDSHDGAILCGAPVGRGIRAAWLDAADVPATACPDCRDAL